MGSLMGFASILPSNTLPKPFNMSSGVAVNDECMQKFQELKLGKKIKYIIYKLDDPSKPTQIVVSDPPSRRATTTSSRSSPRQSASLPSTTSNTTRARATATSSASSSGPLITP